MNCTIVYEIEYELLSVNNKTSEKKMKLSRFGLRKDTKIIFRGERLLHAQNSPGLLPKQEIYWYNLLFHKI